MLVRRDVPVLTFQSRNTSRARIKMPARTATSMIHQGTSVCCATVRSGDTVNVTCNHHTNKIKTMLDSATKDTFFKLHCLFYFFYLRSTAYIGVRSCQDYVFSLTVKYNRGSHNNVQVWKRSIVLQETQKLGEIT